MQHLKLDNSVAIRFQQGNCYTVIYYSTFEKIITLTPFLKELSFSLTSDVSQDKKIIKEYMDLLKAEDTLKSNLKLLIQL